MDDDELFSIEPETGLLEDIEEVRTVSINVLNAFLRIMTTPLMQSITQPGELFDILVSLLLLRAMMKPTTQAQLYREMALLFGQQPGITEQEIREFGMSEEVPHTSERAAHIDMDRQFVAQHLRQGALFATSQFIQEAVRAAEAPLHSVPLSENMERFLEQVQRRTEYDGNADNDPHPGV